MYLYIHTYIKTSAYPHNHIVTRTCVLTHTTTPPTHTLPPTHSLSPTHTCTHTTAATAPLAAPAEVDPTPPLLLELLGELPPT